MTLTQLRNSFFDGYLQWNPQEATTLGVGVGVGAGAGRLRDHGPATLQQERRWYGRMAKALTDIDVDALTMQDRLDHVAMQRIVDHHEHGWDRLTCAVDWSLYPYSMVMVQRVHAVTADDWRAIAERLAAIPQFLEQHQANVERGMRHGMLPDGALCAFFAEQQIPPASTFLRKQLANDPRIAQAAIDAADAYDAHRLWLNEHALANSSPAHRIGEPEMVWRLRHGLGITDSPSDLIAQAKAELERTQQLLVTCAAKLDKSIRDLDGVRTLANTMQERCIARDEDVVPTYRDYIDRALALVKEQRLFNVPEGYAIGVEPLPPGFSAASHAGNWPAPLLDASKLGHFMVAPDAKLHSLAWAADLAVHEGLPGHHLQSFWWQQHCAGQHGDQQHRGEQTSPVRFLLVHDQVAIPRHFWGPMLNIEGYAVYAEELMRGAGFFTADEELFVLLAHAVRAARVIADLSLHAGIMDEPEAVALLVRGVCLPDNKARMEVRRYLQVPLQASTYLLGRLAIEDLVKQCRAREGGAFDLASFHDRFFSFGPVDPAAIGRALAH